MTAPKQPEAGDRLHRSHVDALVAAFARSRCRHLALSIGDSRLSIGEPPGSAPAAAARARRAAPDRMATAPSVGVFEAAGGDDAPRAVTAGAVLGHVRTLSKRTPVEAACAGVAEPLVPSGAFVEYGAALFRIAPRGRAE